MQTILVTGGAGFLGAYLVERLLKNGHRVIVVDNLKTIGGIPFVNPQARFLEKDICDYSLYDNLKREGIDAIYHLAAQSAGESSYDDPRHDILTNSLGTYLLCKFAKEIKAKRFIYTSTVAVYGHSAKDTTREDAAITPDSIYGVSKYSGELFVKQILEKTDTRYTIFRVFNAYGPGENLNYLKKGMVSIYAAYLWRNLPIEVKGSLKRYRDYTYIDDVTDILEQALSNEISFGHTYNLSSGVKTVVEDLLALMIKVAKKPLQYPIKELPGTAGDTHGFHASIEKLSKDFNWLPKYDLKTGLEKYFSWIQQVPVCEDLTPYHPLKVTAQ